MEEDAIEIFDTFEMNNENMQVPEKILEKFQVYCESR